MTDTDVLTAVDFADITSQYKEASDLLNIYLHHVPGDKAFMAYLEAFKQRDAAIEDHAVKTTLLPILYN